ncbi:MAG: hypothetical protein K2L46_00975, partial [Paramuribaculum sp.]|nr:hypothetical protein [Paramuribaculum sp.]
MKRLNLMILTAALFGGVTQAAVKDGVVKYDCRSGRSGNGRYEYTQKQLEKWAKNPRPDAEWRLVERKEPDSVQNKKAQRDTFMRYQKLAEEKLMRLRRVRDLMSCIGKPISDEVDSEIIADLASRPEVMEDRDAIIKDLVKGRISKKCKIYLDDYEADCRVAYEEALYDAECVKEDWLGFYRGKGEPLPEMRMISYVDTVSNPYYYGRVYLDMRENGNWCEYSFREMCCGLSDGWEWLEKENGANDQERIEEFYPHEVTYTRYKSHPQYRIIGNKVFDLEGSLVRIMTPDHDGIVLSSYDYEYGYDESTANDIARQLCVLAYKNNDYNIWSRGLKVNRYIQSKLGLENFERSGPGRYGATSSGARVNTRDDINYTQEGDAWLKQVRSDYRKFFIDQPPYRCERVNGVTFRMIYADEKANPTYEVIHS